MVSRCREHSGGRTDGARGPPGASRQEASGLACEGARFGGDFRRGWGKSERQWRPESEVQKEERVALQQGRRGTELGRVVDCGVTAQEAFLPKVFPCHISAIGGAGWT